MPRGDKDKYTDKQKRMERHIEQGYEARGTGKDEAERRAWATVNKQTGGGNKSGGSGRGKTDTSQRKHVQLGAQSRRQEGVADAPPRGQRLSASLGWFGQIRMADGGRSRRSRV